MAWPKYQRRPDNTGLTRSEISSKGRYMSKKLRADNFLGVPGVKPHPSRKNIIRYVMQFKIPGGARLQEYFPATPNGLKDAAKRYRALRRSYGFPIPKKEK